jgi:hypothetical protein
MPGVGGGGHFGGEFELRKAWRFLGGPAGQVPDPSPHK